MQAKIIEIWQLLKVIKSNAEMSFINSITQLFRPSIIKYYFCK
jgi:hypothetical protein